MEYSDPMLWKDFLEFKNIIFEEKFWKKFFQINSKTVIKNFFHVRLPGKIFW
jgi:hypothetical protein